MFQSITNYFEGQFMPHGHCYFWRPDILWANVLGDGLTALAYFSIPFLLVYFLRKRKDIRFRGIFYLFALFILSCGITHVFTIVSVWEPIYAIEGIAKVLTATFSILTAIVLYKNIPLALKIPSPEKLAEVNNELREEIEQRELAEKQLLGKTTALENSNEFLRQLTYATSHDLKEPLRNITLMAQRFQSKFGEAYKEKEIDDLQIIVSEGKRMIGTIEGLERLDKIEVSGEEMQKISYEKCLKAALDSLKENDQHIKVEMPGILPEWPGYSVLIKELFIELLSNAIKFNNTGQAQVKITSKLEDDVLIIVFEDNGIGFDQKYAERIFRMFEKLEDRNKYPGPGLGLSTCKKIIDIHQGTISAESEPGKGSRFIIKIPKPEYAV